ncbi:S-layer homology domain-containing protein [Sporosarcina cascadiensis]|uniref:S-layer homology domain-containing protein n=1 Tax=Sporosarcina cascadiensis TaxID=2660747 RepID=UPI00129A7323|nr:S-layer homology domain-containing protein [Sporosarcina cascadiensis]
MANQPTKYRKFVVGAASAALVASAVAPVAFAADFSDTKGNTHETAIDALSDAGVITGYPDGSFKPNKTLTRSDVVKLMGKWLKTEGYKVPTDYKTKPRFADLKSSSNDELLQMAALVFDNGVFNGTPDGKLDPNGDITRENMAIVLVRAFDRVHDIDLASYVAAQDFKKDVTDLGKAKAEARPAIDVLDFFDITNPAAPQFNPKETTTRGHFATFLHKTLNADFSDVGTGTVAPGVASVKAINATTVEVAMKDKVDNINSLNFKIDGLTVSNAAVKQTDDKTVVLTTAVQKGGEKYTVTLNEKAIGSFTGVSAVVPSTIKITNQSVQGKTGQQAILSADVGVKQAGIPVTFNVKANTTGTTNKDQIFEAVTNADGIATFSYTQYSAGTDQVTAYPTGAPSVRDLGFVFWGVDTILNIEEVTTGNTVNNGANKTYKVTYKNATTGKPEANRTFNVSLAENLNVTPDKLSNATVNGVKVSQLVNDKTPTTATITTDSKGEATFTVSGTNSKATPVVFGLNTDNNKTASTYEASLLQAKASTVTFAAQQAEYAIELTRDGGEVSAKGVSNGRKYNVVVKNKEGNVAKNEVVNVAFNEDLDRVISTNTQAQFIKVDNNDNQYYAGKQISVKTDNNGKASFIIGSDVENDYATPIAWIDVNTPNAVEGKLDEGEPFTVGSISYFKEAYLDGAALKVFNNAGKETGEFLGQGPAVFKAALVNQSGKAVPNTSIKNVSYTIFNTGASDVKVGEQIISPNRSYTVTYTSPNTDLVVTAAQDKNAAVRVVATGTAIDTDRKDYAFTAKEATATFTGTKEVGAIHTDEVVSYNSDKKELNFIGKDPVKYAGETGVTYAYRGLGNTPIATADDFIKELKKGKVTVTREVKDGTTTFYIVEQDTSKAGPQDLYTGAALEAKNVEKTLVVGGQTLTLTASELVTNNTTNTATIGVTATSSDATVATATVTNNELKITPVAVGTANVTVNVYAGDKSVQATVKVTVRGAGEGVSLGDFTTSIDNNGLGEKVVGFNVNDLPEANRGQSYSTVIDGVTYNFRVNSFNANLYNITVPGTIADSVIKAAVLTTVK